MTESEPRSARSAPWPSRRGASLSVVAMAVVAGGVVAGPSVASAEALRIATGQPPSHAHVHGIRAYAETLKAETSLEPEVFEMSLLNLSEIPTGLRDGIAGMGNVITAYKPAEYAETNLIVNLSMLVTAGERVEMPSAAMSGAVMEYVLFDCPDCLGEFRAMNQVLLAAPSTEDYALLCTRPVHELSDFKGLSFRSGAANFGRWAEHVGGVKVSIPGNEIYEAMSQGVVDCAMLAIGDMVGANLLDVTRFVLDGVPGGVFAGIALNAVNRDLWQGLDDETRAVMIRASARLVADVLTRQHDLKREAIAAGEAAGVGFGTATPETLADYDAFVAQDVGSIAASFSDQYGLADVATKVEVASRLIEKWKALVAEAGTDPDALEQLYWTQIFSRLDPKTYAMD